MKRLASMILLLTILMCGVTVAFSQSGGEVVPAVGDILSFGRYEQDKNTSNGEEPIEWIVLKVEDGKALLISQHALDCQQYNTEKVDDSWETCTLRTWLNTIFLNVAFIEAELPSILITDVSNADSEGNGSWSTSGGIDTQDKVFLLSFSETNIYFENEKAREVIGTAYADNMGSSRAIFSGNSDWWLRSPGERQNEAAFVGSNGSYYSALVSDKVGVRPALWLDLKSDMSEFAYARYAAADLLFNNREYTEAAKAFDALGSYNNSVAKAQECRYALASATQAAGDINTAISMFTALGDYGDSATQVKECHYIQASAAQAAGDLETAISMFTALGAYSDSATQVQECHYIQASAALAAGDLEKAISMFTALGDYSDSVTQVKECRYIQASAAQDADDLDIAISMFTALGDYSDSVIHVRSCYYAKGKEMQANGDSEAANAMFALANNYTAVRSVISFGHYIQDKNTSTEKKPIEWIVLAVEDGKALLLSQYVLDCQQYNTEKIDDSWEACTLRTWLNGTFLSAAFSKAELPSILLYDVSNADSEGNGSWSTIGGIDTQDKVFLLSFSETNTYFEDDKAREVIGTAYADDMGSSRAIFSGNSDWWLRSPGGRQNEASFVGSNGSYYSASVSDKVGVRPALWLNLTSDMGKYDDTRYGQAIAAQNAGDLDIAISLYSALGNYSDSAAKLRECRYNQATAAQESGDLDTAISLFCNLGNYQDSSVHLKTCYYAKGELLASKNEYEAAYNSYILAKDYEGVAAKVAAMAYETGMIKISEGDYDSAMSWFVAAGNYHDTKEQILSIGEYYYENQQYDLAESVFTKSLGAAISLQRLYEIGRYYEETGDSEQAVRVYRKVGKYQDSSERADAIENETIYQQAESLMHEGEYEAALELYTKIPGYKENERTPLPSKTFTLKITAKHGSYNHVGSSWTKHYSLNNEEVKNNIKVKLKYGDTITVEAEISQNDSDPDTGWVELTHTVTEEDLKKGFTLTGEVDVEENRGRYSGYSCSWTVAFSFK